MVNIKIQAFFLNKKNINWLKDKDEFLKLYNEIIKDEKISVNTSENRTISSYDFKNFLESILNGDVNYSKIEEKKKLIILKIV